MYAYNAKEGGRMEFLKSQLARVQEQFSHLTASQKMLAAALVVITVMTLYWWTTFAGKAEMEVLFDQPMSSDQIAQAIAQLRAANIDCEMRFSMHGWSVLYKTGSGSGTITCDNGQHLAVTVRAKGGGLTVGKSSVEDGLGKFSEERHVTVQVYAMYWHFVDAVWVFVFPAFILSPHIR